MMIFQAHIWRKYLFQEIFSEYIQTFENINLNLNGNISY